MSSFSCMFVWLGKLVRARMSLLRLPSAAFEAQRL